MGSVIGGREECRRGTKPPFQIVRFVITLSIGVYGRIESWVVDVDLMGTDTDNRPIRLV